MTLPEETLSGKAEKGTILNKLKDFRVDDEAGRELRAHAPQGLSRGREAMALLARSVEVDDAGASSHWRAMHQTFTLAGEAVSGADRDSPQEGDSLIRQRS